MVKAQLATIAEFGSPESGCQIVVVTNENASRHSIDCILVYIMSGMNERIYRQNRGKIRGKT